MSTPREPGAEHLPELPPDERPGQLPALPPEIHVLDRVEATTGNRVHPVTAPTRAGDTLLVLVAVGNQNAELQGLTDSKGNRYVVDQHEQPTPVTRVYRAEGATGGPVAGQPTAALTTSDTLTVACAAANNVQVMIAVHLRGVGPMDQRGFAAGQSGPIGPVMDVTVTPRTAGQCCVALSINQGGGGPADWAPPFTRLVAELADPQWLSCAFVLDAGPAGQPVRAQGQLDQNAGWRVNLWSFHTEVEVTTTELPEAIEGVPYPPTQLTATGGLPPYEWWLAYTLPAGITMTLGGLISGTPARGIADYYPLIFQARDTAGGHGDWPTTMRVLPAVQITTPPLPPGAVGRPYAADLLAAWGREPYTWAVSGLPAGLALDGAQITGTPTEGGEFDAELRVTDDVGGTDTATLPLVIEAIPPLEILTAGLPPGQVGQVYDATVQAEGGVPPYAWAAAGLAPGLELFGTRISGVPTADGDFEPELTVTDQEGTTAQRSYPLIIAPRAGLRITTAILPRAIIDLPYEAVIEAEGGTVPYLWSLRGLPPGLAEADTIWPSLTARITGIPAELGDDFEVTASVADWEGDSDEVLLGLAVVEPPEIPEPEIVPERLVPVIWDGLDLNPGDREDGITLVTTDVDGWFGSPPQHGNELDRALTDGAVFGAKVTGPRTITLTGGAAGPHAGLVSLARQLAAKTVVRQPAQLAVGEGDDPATPLLTAMVRAGEDRLNCAWHGRYYLTWQVVLTAADPRLHEDRWREATLRFALSEGTGRDYDWTPPRAYALTTLPNTARLANPGNVPAIVTITYTGPLDETRLTDGSGRTIRVGALADRQQVTVDSGSLVALAPGGAPRASYILAGSQPLLLPPGAVTSWRLAGTGNGFVALAWRGAWT